MKGYNNNVGNNSKLQKLRDVGIMAPQNEGAKTVSFAKYG